MGIANVARIHAWIGAIWLACKQDCWLSTTKKPPQLSPDPFPHERVGWLACIWHNLKWPHKFDTFWHLTKHKNINCFGLCRPLPNGYVHIHAYTQCYKCQTKQDFVGQPNFNSILFSTPTHIHICTHTRCYYLEPIKRLSTNITLQAGLSVQPSSAKVLYLCLSSWLSRDGCTSSCDWRLNYDLLECLHPILKINLHVKSQTIHGTLILHASSIKYIICLKKILCCLHCTIHTSFYFVSICCNKMTCRNFLSWLYIRIVEL